MGNPAWVTVWLPLLGIEARLHFARACAPSSTHSRDEGDGALDDDQILCYCYSREMIQSIFNLNRRTRRRRYGTTTDPAPDQQASLQSPAPPSNKSNSPSRFSTQGRKEPHHLLSRQRGGGATELKEERKMRDKLHCLCSIGLIPSSGDFSIRLTIPNQWSLSHRSARSWPHLAWSRSPRCACPRRSPCTCT